MLKNRSSQPLSGGHERLSDISSYKIKGMVAKLRKYCGLGLVGFPNALQGVAILAVSLSGHFAVLPRARLDYHLVHTAIHSLLQVNSLGDFLNAADLFIASLANQVSNSRGFIFPAKKE
ncbi:MAG: hypothetical protein ACM3WV_06790 [Bacillota bacterium]